MIIWNKNDIPNLLPLSYHREKTSTYSRADIYKRTKIILIYSLFNQIYICVTY